MEQQQKYKLSGSRSRAEGNSHAQQRLVSKPCTPSMSSFEVRLASFRNWPSHVAVTPSNLAEAGFFYLGELDRTKCFYCNGGLQQWKHEKDPWLEHAKWYPICEFLLQNKGADYVHDTFKRYPNLKRPIANQPAGTSHCKLRIGEHGSILPRPILADCPTSSSESTSSSSNMELEQRLARAMRAEIVQEASKFGFAEGLVRELVARKLMMNGEQYPSVVKLVEDLQYAERRAEANLPDESNLVSKLETLTITKPT